MFSVSCLAHLSTTCSKGSFYSGPVAVVRRQQFLNTSTPKPLGQFGLNLAEMVLGRFLFRNCSQNLIPSKTLVAVATEWIFLRFFKNLLLWNRWADFEIVSQECSMGDPFQKLFAKF